ncbi:MAG: polysaccharide biosynthesis protein, partial [Psychromonas sp.]|nr:polysaccharide biosynthesis protein [Psychromonas sp.]
MTLINSILSMPRIYKRILSVFVDTLFISIAFFGAFFTRLGEVAFLNQSGYWQLLVTLLLATLIVFTKVGLYRAILRYLSVHALLTIVFSCFFSVFLLIVFAYFYGLFLPRSVPIIYGAYLVWLCGGARLLVRMIVSQQMSKQKQRVIIYGAGDSGRQLVNLLRQGNEYHPVAFIDDEKRLLNTVVNGLTVFSSTSLHVLISKLQVSKVLLAMPSATRSQ